MIDFFFTHKYNFFFVFNDCCLMGLCVPGVIEGPKRPLKGPCTYTIWGCFKTEVLKWFLTKMKDIHPLFFYPFG